MTTDLGTKYLWVTNLPPGPSLTQPNLSSLILQHSPELGLDAGVAQSDSAVQVVRVGVRLYLVIVQS